jgi:hypothetical protein
MPTAWDQLQDEVCARHGVPVARPSSADYVGIDPRGLLPAEPTVYGARHEPLFEGESGWYFTTDDDGDGRLVKVHVGHLAEVCPAVLPFLALPPGWYFDTASGAAAFDPSLLADESDG